MKRFKEDLLECKYSLDFEHFPYSQVRFMGPLTYMKSADQRYTPTRPLQEESDAAWSLIVDG